ncbi:unnamed protein product [Spirodela intermedia]|uniref:Uncharacterized protein n=1 Tax=Spirodela intermedia TaxID=51605 RepID=A0A7I8JD27_SPIIN|nr:unnamed protein product [Spirodela intermedia]CAA6667635.1 unnamed protein product [Spirodela intermedia]
MAEAFDQGDRLWGQITHEGALHRGARRHRRHGRGIAGAFTYVCLHPIDTVKTKLQTKGAAQIYSSAIDVALKTFQASGILGFYRGVSAVIVGSAVSSSIYFGTCELGKSVLGKLSHYPPLLIPPTAGAMGNIVSSAIMVPKELITQRMQAGAAGRSWEVLLRILEKDGILGLYAGYSATLLRNLPAGIMSYSSFEYLKSFVLSRTGKANLEPVQSVVCGALAGAISASLTTPLDVVKTRLMTQIHGEARNRISDTVRQILVEEGWPGLFRGMGPRVLHSACFAALGYFAFETARLTLCIGMYSIRNRWKVLRILFKLGWCLLIMVVFDCISLRLILFTGIFAISSHHYLTNYSHHLSLRLFFNKILSGRRNLSCRVAISE